MYGTGRVRGSSRGPIWPQTAAATPRTCTQTITVDDVTPPTITCPADLTFECITEVPAPDITQVMASDNCGMPVVTWEGDVWNGTCPRIITRTYMATDSCGNTTQCTQTITVDDVTPPTITCPAGPDL